tara:strand:- start:2949 stop:3674 length:726 start_codon:yes stop_codon:yes gene_type:complete
MSGFSSLLDISSFFIGVLVNLLLVAMICFYFKRKIDNLELSQSEQAKILFQLLQQGPPQGGISSGLPDKHAETFHLLNGLDLTQLNPDGPEPEQEQEENDSDSDDSEDSDDESEEGETKTIEYEEVVPVENIEKLTVREIRSLLEENGVSDIKKSAKKQELIDMYTEMTTQKEEVIEQVVKVDDTEESSEQEEEESEQEEENQDSEESTEVRDVIEDIVQDIKIEEVVPVIEINSEITDIS